jgi:hypothetical protein
MRLSMRKNDAAMMSCLLLAGVMLSGCGSNGASGVSTASILDGKAGATTTGEIAGVKADDPTAKSVQVAWTAARAQKCGFNFDAAKLKANYLGTEARGGAQPAQLTAFEKTYDTTFANVSTNIKADDAYCSERKTAAIKADLQRHLAGNYEPNLPQEKKVASGGFFDMLKSDSVPEAYDPKNFWADQEARRNGAKGAQRSE